MPYLTRKPFDPGMFSSSDLPARDALRRYFAVNAPGYTLVDSSQFDVDLEVWYGGRLLGYAELERKLCWKGKDFPFDTVDWQAKKLKYKVDLPTLYFMFNEDFTYATWCNLNEAGSTFLKYCKILGGTTAELFFSTPWDPIRKLVIPAKDGTHA